MNGMIETYIDRKVFFTQYRQKLDSHLTQDQVDAINDFLNLLEEDERIPTNEEKAYVLATVFHETNQTFKPVREAYWLPESWREANLRYYPWYGRGFVQLTWEANYKKMSKKLGVDLLTNPDKAMGFVVSYDILVLGMRDGDFTGRKLADFWDKSGAYDYVEARRIVNGTDKQHKIAMYAFAFEDILDVALKIAKPDPVVVRKEPEKSTWAKLVAALKELFA